MEQESQRFPVVGLCCYIENTFCLPNTWVDLKHGGKCHVKSSVPRLAENRWLVKVKMALTGGKKKSSLSTPYPVCFYFCLCSVFVSVLPPYWFVFFYLNPLILPLSIYFLRWRAKQKMKAALVSSHILSSRPPIFSSTSKVPEQEGLCVMCARVCVDFAIASLNLLMYVCWLLVPTIILFLYLIRL